MAGDGTPAPSSEAPGPGKEHDELLKVLDALGANKSQRLVAQEALDADPAEPWNPNGGPRSKSRRRIEKAEALRDGGYMKFLVPGGTRRRRRRKPEGDPE